MLTEKGTLPVGVEYEGKTHKDFEIREQLVSDMIDIFDDPVHAVRAEKNNYFFGACILSKLIVSIGTISKEAITPELLLGMFQDDLNEIKLAEARLDKKRKSFRESDKEK
jgi:hypothetical protein